MGSDKVNWIYLSMNKVKLRALVNTVMNFMALYQLSAYLLLRKDLGLCSCLHKNSYLGHSSSFLLAGAWT